MSENHEQVIIRSVELLRPQQGDTLLVTVPGYPSREQRAAIAKGFQDAWGLM